MACTLDKIRDVGSTAVFWSTSGICTPGVCKESIFKRILLVAFLPPAQPSQNQFCDGARDPVVLGTRTFTPQFFRNERNSFQWPTVVFCFGDDFLTSGHSKHISKDPDPHTWDVPVICRDRSVSWRRGFRSIHDRIRQIKVQTDVSADSPSKHLCKQHSRDEKCNHAIQQQEPRHQILTEGHGQHADLASTVRHGDITEMNKSVVSVSRPRGIKWWCRGWGEVFTRQKRKRNEYDNDKGKKKNDNDKGRWLTWAALLSVARPENRSMLLYVAGARCEQLTNFKQASKWTEPKYIASCCPSTQINSTKLLWNKQFFLLWSLT